jgi:hypothetical protein
MCLRNSLSPRKAAVRHLAWSIRLKYQTEPATEEPAAGVGYQVRVQQRFDTSLLLISSCSLSSQASGECKVGDDVGRGVMARMSLLHAQDRA